MGIVVRQSFLNLISIGIAFLIGAVNTLYLYPSFLGSKLQGLIIALLAISNLLQPFISFGTPGNETKIFPCSSNHIPEAVPH